MVLRSIVTHFRGARNTFWLLTGARLRCAVVVAEPGLLWSVAVLGRTWAWLKGRLVWLRCFFKYRDEQHVNPETSWYFKSKRLTTSAHHVFNFINICSVS